MTGVQLIAVDSNHGMDSQQPFPIATYFVSYQRTRMGGHDTGSSVPLTGARYIAPT